METLLQDLRYAMRGLRRAPAFTAVAMLTLALGIGVNSAIFGIVNAILLKPLPVERPAQLVDIYGHDATSPTHDTHSYPNYVDFRRQATTVSGLIAYSNFFAHMSIAGSSDLVVGELATDNYFTVLGIRPLIGRVFGPEEHSAPGAAPVAVLSHRLWQMRFGGDANVVGRTLRMNGVTYTIIGVAPAEFGGMVPAVTAQMWIPVSMAEQVEPLGNQRSTGRHVGADRFEQRTRAWLWMKGRIKPGADVAEVRAELDGMSRQLAATYPESNANERITVVPTRDVRINPDIDRTLTPVGIVLVGAVGLVLIVACANLANLMLARAASRGRELAVRLAVGADRGRLVRQLMTESVLLALAGGVVALPLAAALGRVIMQVQPPLPVDFGFNVSVDWRVLTFTFAAAVATGIVFGLVPALRASRPDLVPALKDAGSSTGHRRRIELRDALVVVQMAVSLVLLVGGALLVRSLDAATRVNLGYDADRMARFSLAMEMNGYNRERSGRFFEDARLRLLGHPQVEAVALSSRAPLSLNNNGFGVFIDGRQASASDRPFTMDGTYADERYLDALQLRLVAGRWIETADRFERRRVAVVSETMARRYWPDGALGREFRLRWGGDPHTIVGVVADYRVDTPGEEPKSYIHLPLSMQETYAEFIVRTRSSATGQLETLKREFLAMDPSIVFLDVGTLRGAANVRLFPVRAGAWLIGAFGLLALAVAAVGLYGVIGYSVSRRVREIGIRKALGAQPGALVRMVLGEGMLLVGVGGLVGAALAGLAAQALSSVLFVPPFDVASFGIAFGVLAVVALTANWVPARRAAGVDPIVALRQE